MATNPDLSVDRHSLYSMEFDGSNYINLGTDSTLEFTNNFSISLWIKETTTSLNRGVIVSGDFTNNSQGWKIQRTSTNKIAFNCAARTATSTTSINTGDWFHVLATWETAVGGGIGNRNRIYINGILEGTSTTGAAFSPTYTGTIYKQIAYPYNTTGNEFVGKLDEIAIWNVALDNNQIQALSDSKNSPVNIMALDPKPIAYYPLGEQARVGGNSNPNAGSSEWQFPNQSIQSTAVDFNGSSDYIDAGSSIGAIGTGVTTFSVWLKTSYTGGIQTILSTRDQSANNGWVLQINSTSIQFFNEKNNTNIYTENNPTLTDGFWHNIVIVRGGSTATNAIYQDGSPITLTINTENGTSPQSASNLSIGSTITSTSSPRFFDGEMSNVAIWNSDQSSEKDNIWNNGTPATSYTNTPTAWCKLNAANSSYNTSNSTWTFTDSAGSNNGTSTTLPTSALVRSDLQFESPYSNFSLDLDGTGNHVDCGVNNSLVSATNFSVSGWFYFDASAATGKTFFSYGSSTGPQYGFTAQTFSGGNILFAIANSVSDSGSNLIITNLTTPLTTGQWYNITCTFDGSQTGNTNRAKVYVNGTQAPISGSGSGLIPAITSPSTGPFNIGKWDLGSSNNRYFNGKVDEVSIFNYTLNDSQINQVYNNGLAADLTSLSPASWWRLGEDAYFVNNNITIPNQVTGGPSGTGSGTQTSMLVADAPGSYGSGSGVNLDIVDRIGEAPGTSPANVANSQSYNMIPDDRHTYVPGYVPAQVNNVASMSFDGVNDYFDLGSGFNIFRYNINESYTISLWYKTTSALGDRTLINLGANTYKFFLTSGNGGKISFGAGVSTSNAAVYNWLPTAGAINDGEWHHICVVQDSSSGTVNLTPYVDGSSSGSGGGTAFTVQVNNRIGLGHYGGIPCGLDEVAIFNYALTPRQIKEDIYNASTTGKTADLNNNSNLTAPVAWYRMGD